MKAKCSVLLGIVLFLLTTLPEAVAISVTTRAAAPTRTFIFIENNNDDNYFVTPAGTIDPRMTGSNRWTGLKYTGAGTIYQQSLGYVDDGYNTTVPLGYKFDMWLEDSPASHPLRGLRCINWYVGCNMDTSLILPQVADENGFYGVSRPTSGGAMWAHGMMADSFYHALQQMAVGNTFSMKINFCYTSVSYDASAGERCKDQASGTWYSRIVTHTKGAHLKLISTNALSEVFINSDGVPTLGEGNADCKIQTIGSLSGMACKMVNYTLQSNGVSNTSVHIFPSISNSALASAVSSRDMQFSLDGSSWKLMNSYYSFNEMKSAEAIYIFFSSNFFKQMVNLGISDINTRDLFNFRLSNLNTGESGWYEFSTSNTIIVKPRDFSISIISDDYTESPVRTGNVGAEEPELNFGYIVTTSGRTAADEVLIKVVGDTRTINGRAYCVFSSADGTTQVPFPAGLSFTTQSGVVKTYDVGCDSGWRDMTDALWISSPWNDISGDVGLMNKTTVNFAIQMNDPLSLRTIEDDGWFGDVSASGTIYVQATWRDIE